MRTKSNYFERYAITSYVILYHLIHFFSIWVIHKCQSGIDFFYKRARSKTLVKFMNKITMTTQVFSGKKHGSETSNVYPWDKYQ